jgi:hypothetical protein
VSKTNPPFITLPGSKKKIIMVPEIVKLEADFDFPQKEIHYFDLFDHEYQQRTSPVGFYNQFRNLVIASLKKKGDIITWQNDTVLIEDEQLSPTFEELILAIVLALIDPGLPGQVRNEYRQLLGRTKDLMNYRDEILTQVPSSFIKTEISLPAVCDNKEEHLDRYRRMCFASSITSLLNSTSIY